MDKDVSRLAFVLLTGISHLLCNDPVNCIICVKDALPAIQVTWLTVLLDRGNLVHINHFRQKWFVSHSRTHAVPRRGMSLSQGLVIAILHTTQSFGKPTFSRYYNYHYICIIRQFCEVLWKKKTVTKNPDIYINWPYSIPMWFDEVYR